MTPNTEKAKQISMCCAAPIKRTYDGVVCT